MGRHAKSSEAILARQFVIRNVTYLGVHLLSGESLALSDGTGRSLLERNTLESLVQVQSVISDSVLHLLLTTCVFGHLTDHK